MYSAAQKAAVAERYRSWTGSQGAYAASLGLPTSTVARWIAGVERGSGPLAAPYVQAAPVARVAPRMLEVVPRSPVVEPRRGSGAVARLVFSAGVELTFDALPPAAWIAELAAELRRC